eukprot:gene3146-4281_t
MTSFFTGAPSYCSRFGVAALLVVLADFLFYGQPAGITVFLFAILIAAAVVAVHPTAFSDIRVWLKPVALLVALLPLAENVSALSVSIALSAFVYPVFAHWVWGNALQPSAGAFLANLGFVDFAGSTVVHATGGWVALAACMVLGARNGRFEPDGRPIRIAGHSP